MRKFLGLLLMFLPLIAVAQNGIDGTWRVDLNKAQLDTKPRVYELKDGVYTCSTCDPKITMKADGQDHPVTGSPYIDTASITVVNNNTTERVGKKGGKVVVRETMTVSPDGKMLTQKFEEHPAASDQAVTATGIYSRVGEPEAGTHALSGSWKTEKYESVSENGLTFTYAMGGDGLKFKASTGESYNAKFDGKDYPYHGDPGTTAVVLKKIDDHTFEETYKRGSEVVGVAKIAVSADGKSLHMVNEDKRRGTTDTMVAEKQAGNGAIMADK